MISEIYRKYFQKSYTFLFPLLGFNKKKHPRPIQTYVSWDGQVDINDRKLICVYKREDTDKWRTFESGVLITNKYLDYCLPIDDETIAYVFDLNTMHQDFDACVNGKYSQLSTTCKKILCDYYGVHTPEWVYIESFIFPEKYFAVYANILNIDEDLLRTVGELCEGFNREKETFINQLNTIKNEQVNDGLQS